MNVFEAVKQNVTTRQAAELYGIRVGRNGMAVCPFHNDKNTNTNTQPCFRKTIDKTTYIVRVHFSETATETMADKIKRMLRDEVRKM